MSTPFSASAQAVGYLFQARRALCVLLESRDDSQIVIEGLDDISVQDGEERLKLEQLKHHIKSEANLTDQSPDLWKTLRVWSTLVAKRHIEIGQTTLILVTTNSAGDGSIASLLRDNSSRDASEALSRLTQVASSNGAGSLKACFEAFNALTTPERELLIEAITVLDSAPSITDTENVIRAQIRYATRPQFIDAVFERLEGWWFGRVVQQLVARSIVPIPQAEVHAKLNSIAEQLRDDALPIDFLGEEPEVIDADADDRMFVRQLRQVTRNKRRIENAIVDFYRAYEQRSKWLREELLLDNELDAYEARLREEWERYKLALEDALNLDTSDEKACDSFATRMYNWMELEADLPIRTQVSEGYVMRGSFHILANHTVPRVWWHPLFIERLKSAVTT